MSVDTANWALLREVADRQEIEQVVRRYCRAIDRLDVELLKSVYHPDATDSHGNFTGNAHDFADFIIEELRGTVSYGFHTITQSIIDIGGDSAAAESTYFGYHRIPPGWDSISSYFGKTYASEAKTAGTLSREHEYVCGGRYVDRFERRSGSWKIAKRIITNEWRQTGPALGDQTEGKLAAFNLPGARDRSDPVYRILLR
jgi:SnoaL-like domain